MDTLPELKRCSHCGLQKSCAEFGRNKSKPDGLQTECKICRRLYGTPAYHEVVPVPPSPDLARNTGRKRGKTVPTSFEEIVGFFWSKVEKGKGCWIWKGPRGHKGYGQITYVKANGRTSTLRAHRVSYQIHKGEPGEFFVCHSCDNPPCVNPDHLWLGTHNDNMQDMVKKQRLFPGVEAKSPLTREAVLHIRSVYTHKYGQLKQLAEQYGVDPMTIRRVVRREVWKHI